MDSSDKERGKRGVAWYLCRFDRFEAEWINRYEASALAEGGVQEAIHAIDTEGFSIDVV